MPLDDRVKRARVGLPNEMETHQGILTGVEREWSGSGVGEWGGGSHFCVRNYVGSVILPTYKLLRLTQLHGCWQNIWHSWVRDRGQFITHSNISNQKVITCIDSLSPSSYKVMQRPSSDTCMWSKLCFRRGTLSSKVEPFIISHSLACLLLWRQTQSLLSDSGHHTNILKGKSRRKGVSDTAGKMFCKMKDPWSTINTYTPLVHQVWGRMAFTLQDSKEVMVSEASRILSKARRWRMLWTSMRKLKIYGICSTH